MPYSQTPALVSANWLNHHRADPSLIVVDCRWRLTDKDFGRQAFTQGHIPNSQRLDLDRQLSSPPGRYGGRHPLPEPEQFSAAMEEIGISDSSYVVCYDDDMAGAARLWWCLLYYGHAQVSVLDGGIKAWVKAGYSLEPGGAATVAPGQFTEQPDPRMVVGYQTVRSLAPVYPVIDARNPERYSGTVEPMDRVGGHIPGALNVPYPSLLTEEGTFHDPHTLNDIFAAILHQSSQPIVYCGSGITACVDALALRHTGAEPLLYPGSWSDWIQHEDAPIASS